MFNVCVLVVLFIAGSNISVTDSGVGREMCLAKANVQKKMKRKRMGGGAAFLLFRMHLERAMCYF